MKSVLKTMVGLVVVGFVLAGCGGGDDEESSLVGTWTWTKATINGITVTADNVVPGGSTVIDPAWISTMSGGMSIGITVTFNANGTFTATLLMTAPDGESRTESANGTWSTSGDQLTLSATATNPDTGVPQTMTQGVKYDISGSKMTCTITSDDIRAVVTQAGETIPPEAEPFLANLSIVIEFTK